MSTIAGKCRCGLSAGTVRRIRPPVQTRFKICCIQTPEEARLAIEAGASALGLVSAMPSGPGEIPDALIAEIAKDVPPMWRLLLAPFAVDVCTGVRDDRFALDPGLLERFSAAVAGL